MKARFKAGEVQDKQNRVEGARLQSNSSHKSGEYQGKQNGVGGNKMIIRTEFLKYFALLIN